MRTTTTVHPDQRGGAAETGSFEVYSGGSTGVRGRFGLLLVVTLALGCGTTEEDRPAGAGLPAEVEAFLLQYVTAMETGDTAQVRRSIGDGDRFVWLEDGEVRYRSADDVLRGLEGLPAGSTIRTELRDVRVAPIGSTGAHAWADFETTVGEGAAAFSFGGAMSVVLERAGGSWVLVGGHTSTLRPGDGR